MWMALGFSTDLFHAIAMACWFIGLPLLFVKRWPRARLAYAVYAVVFIVLSQLSMVLFGECFLTVAAQWCFHHNPSHVVSNDWFTERIARAVFGMAPSRHIISKITEALVLVTAAGALISIARIRRHLIPLWRGKFSSLHR